MMILLSMGVATTVTVFYLGKKGWQAFHKAVGITPGTLTYQNPQVPLSINKLTWQNLTLNKQHLICLSDVQLHQLQYIDGKVAIYHNYQQSLQQQNISSTITEQQFVLHKLLHTRLAEMLASYHHLVSVSTDDTKKNEASQLLQNLLDNIELRLQSLLAQMENEHLQDLRVMKHYIDSHH